MKIDEMVILHIAHIEGRKFSGVDVAVPQHIKAQQKYVKAAIVNVANKQIEPIDNLFSYETSFDIQKLPEPFCQPDLIVFHEIYRPAFLKISYQAKKLGIPYIIIPHGGLTATAQKQKRLKKILGNFLLFNRFIHNAIAIQCLSKREMNESRCVQEKFIGSNGISTTVRKTDFSQDGINLIYIGRLDIHVKGMDLLLQALSNCRTCLLEKKCKLIIYGPDEFGEHTRLSELIRELKLDNIVSLQYQITGEEKINALCGADCFVQTSRTEGMPMGILEAQAMGLPCITTVGTGMTELIEKYDSGWTCPTTVDGIESAILRFLKEYSEIELKSENAIRMIEENFEWEYVAKNALSIYKKYIEQAM